MPEALAPVADGDTARCVLVPRGGRNEPPAYTLFREQAVGDGSFVETLRVDSNRPVATTVRLAITADADFTDQFELRSDHRTYAKTGAVRTPSSPRRRRGVHLPARRVAVRAPR